MKLKKRPNISGERKTESGKRKTHALKGQYIINPGCNPGINETKYNISPERATDQ
jgi:hypothetical protein